MRTPRPTQSGIYVITNTTNGKRYIGSAQHIPKRWREHQWALRNGRHHSWRLQRAYWRDGMDAFTFAIIEEVADKAQLIPREQHLLDDRFAACGSPEYNICAIAGSSAGVIRTEEWRQNISRARKGKNKGKPWSPERRAAQTERSGDTLTEAQKAGYLSRKLRPRSERELAADKLKSERPLNEKQQASILKATVASHAKPPTEKQRTTSRKNLEKAREVPLSEAQLAALARGRANGAGHAWSEEERQKAKTRPRPAPNANQLAALATGRELGTQACRGKPWSAKRRALYEAKKAAKAAQVNGQPQQQSLFPTTD